MSTKDPKRIQRVGDAANREEWLEGRKRRLGASEITGWIGPSSLPNKYAWYFEDNTREGIIAEKFGGVEKEFGPYAEVSMAHGAHDEENIIAKVQKMLACPVEPDNSQFVNERWPYIAATVDGYVGYDPTSEPETRFCQDDEQVEKVLRGLSRLEEGDMTVLEIKKSVSVGWARNEVAPYYVNQVQTQLHILDLDFGVIAAECLFKHPKEKWRLFWDLRPFIIERDPAWANTLDRVNAEFQEALDTHANL
jgi:hypothetical protein